jgi:endoglucanase
MNKIFEIICYLSEFPQITTLENAVSIQEYLEQHPILKNGKMDSVGNIIFNIKGKSKNPKKILFEAHRDEIGLCVKEVLEGGYLSIVNCGGISSSILPGTEFTVYGKKPIHAIATSLPPHLKEKKEKKEKLSIEDVFLDVGSSSKNETSQFISCGDPIRFYQKPKLLLGDKICSPSLDNKVSIAAILHAISEFNAPENDLYFLLSVGEESTSRGVRFSVKDIEPDVCYVLDAGFAMADGLDQTHCIECGMGPSVSFTDTLSTKTSKEVYQLAIEENIPIQRIAEPGGTGTSATAIQLENQGIPTAVISIPVFNMHTPSEIVKMSDIIETAKLIVSLGNKKYS